MIVGGGLYESSTSYTGCFKRTLAELTDQRIWCYPFSLLPSFPLRLSDYALSKRRVLRDRRPCCVGVYGCCAV